METEVAGKENITEPAVDDVVEVTAGGDTDDAAATEEAAGADDPAGENATKDAAAEAGGGSGDRTDGPEAPGAPGATPIADPSAAAAASGSEEPQPGVYLKSGENVFINLPWASSSRAPVEGEIFDGEVVTSAG